MTGILIVAHAPLAHALRQCALHVFPDCERGVQALDVQPHVSPDETFGAARIAMAQMGGASILVLTDVFGATPCNVAQRLVDGVRSKLVAGVNLPSLIKLIDIRAKLPLDQAVKEAIEAGRKYMRAGSADLG